MNIIADTNLLVRLFVQDDELQFQKVLELFNRATCIIIPTNTICELVWVLSYSYKLSRLEINEIIKDLLELDKAVLRYEEVKFGLEALKNNGDFADAINAYTGMEMLKNETVSFATFDKKALKVLQELGVSCIEL